MRDGADRSISKPISVSFFVNPRECKCDEQIYIMIYHTPVQGVRPMSFATMLFLAIVIVWILGGIGALSKRLLSWGPEEVPEPDDRVIGEIDELLEKVFEGAEACARQHPEDRFVEEGCLERERVRMDINGDVLRLYSYLAAEEGAVTPAERSMMLGVLGYVPSDESIASLAEAMKQSLTKREFVFSPLCVHLARLGCHDVAEAYLDALVGIGEIMLRESGKQSSSLALESFYATAKRTLASESATRWQSSR